MSASRRPSIRDRDLTRQRILAAVGEVLAADGFRALGINAVARRAGADKVLIYRYFGALPALLAAYAEDGDFWWRVHELIGPELPPPTESSFAAWLPLLFRRHAAALRARPVTLEIMAWETVESNELTEALAAVRERRSLQVMNEVAARCPPPAGVDIAALAALLGAATNYLLIRARGIRQFQSVDLSSDAGWERLFTTIGQIGRALEGG
jgi:AcrR family transcriptional regulator